jgi:hypothetical protein
MATEERIDCAVCSKVIPAAEREAHGGYCAECHAEAADDAERLLEMNWDITCSIEEVTEIILAYRNLKEVEAMMAHHLTRKDREPRPRPRLHRPG